MHSRDPNARIRVMGTDRSILELLTTRSEAEIRRVIEWCQSDTFWRARIVSGNKLVEHFDALFAQASAVTPEPEDDDYWRNVVIAPPEPVAP